MAFRYILLVLSVLFPYSAMQTTLLLSVANAGLWTVQRGGPCLANCPTLPTNQFRPRCVSLCNVTTTQRVHLNSMLLHIPLSSRFQKVQPVALVIRTAQPAVVQAKRAQVQHEMPPPAPALPLAQADVSMKEEELCQAFSNTLFPVEDIDEGDADMPQLCPEYVKDIYVYLRSLEVPDTFKNITIYLIFILQLLCSCSRVSCRFVPVICVATISMEGCVLSWLTGWFRCTQDFSSCRKPCTWP